jgi:hypothetical protein
MNKSNSWYKNFVEEGILVRFLGDKSPLIVEAQRFTSNEE